MICSDKKINFDITQVKGKAYAEMKDAHYHPYYEFYYLLSGTRKIFINDTIYSVKKFVNKNVKKLYFNSFI